MFAPGTSPASFVAPGRPAGTGSAVIFRNSNAGAIGIYQRAQQLEAARLAREAAARAKADAERFKQMQTGLKLDDDTAPYYQEPYSGMVAEAKQNVGSLYNAASGTYVADPFNRQSMVDKTVAPVHTYKRLADDDWNGIVKPSVATAKADKELRGDDIEKQIYNAHFDNGDPTTGKLIAPSDLKKGYHDEILNDPKNINQAVAIDNFAKTIPGSQDYATLIKGKPGTYSEADDLMTRFAAIQPDGKGGHQVKIGANGLPVLRNPLALLQATQGTRVGKLLDYDMQQQNALREAAIKKMQNQEQLTPEERAAANGPQKTKLDFLTERLMGHVVIKSKESRQYIPLPRPRAAAAAAPGFIAPDGQLVPGEIQGTVQTTPDTNRDAGGFVPAVGGLDILGKMPVTQAGTRVSNFPHLGQGKQVLTADKYGNPKAEVRVRGLRATRYYSEDGSGNFVETPNNTVPQDGVLGRSVAHAVDVATGKPLFGKTEAELKAAIASGRAKPQMFIEYETDKNTNFGDSYEADLASRKEANENSANPKSIAELEAASKKAVSQGVRRHLIPYDPQNAQQIDARTKNFYRAAQATMLRNARGYRAEVPVTPKRPTGTDLGAPKAAGTRSTGIKWN
jgi:hypothetical protein